MSSESERIIGFYQRHALAWVKDRGNRLDEKAWLDRFRGLLPAKAAVLDVGCGSGEPIARYLMGEGCELTGIDASPPMIAQARTAFPGGDWQVTDMRSLALARTFNGIIAWDSFFHLNHEGQRRLFPIFRAHAAPRAALMFTSGPAHGEAIGKLYGEPLYHASLDPAEYRGLLGSHGFMVIDRVTADPTCGGRTVWLAQLR